MIMPQQTPGLRSSGRVRSGLRPSPERRGGVRPQSVRGSGWTRRAPDTVARASVRQPPLGDLRPQPDSREGRLVTVTTCAASAAPLSTPSLEQLGHRLKDCDPAEQAARDQALPARSQAGREHRIPPALLVHLRRGREMPRRDRAAPRADPRRPLRRSEFGRLVAASAQCPLPGARGAPQDRTARRRRISGSHRPVCSSRRA